MASPITNIRIIKSPLSLDNKNQITFNNVQEQYNYFNSLEFLEVNDASYQRKDNIIRYPEHIDNIREFNYCMYQNDNYSNKWFYAFITNMTYENDGMTLISIITDAFQTWQFDIIYKQSFVEREMINVNDDVPGANLIPEGLETGEFQIDGTAEFNELQPIAVIAYSRNPKEDGLTENDPSTSQGVIANGIPNGMFFWLVSFNYLQGALHTINSKGFGNAIITIFTVPAFALIGFNGWTLNDLLDGVSWWFVQDFKASPITKTLVSTPSQLDGYSPRNQKLRSYPYVYLGFNPSNGSSKIYRYENFENGTPIFKMFSEINQNPTICFIPQNYRGATNNSMSDMSTMQGYPTLGWFNDVYNTWLAQNSEIISLNMKQEQFNYEISAYREGVNLGSQIIGSGFAGATNDIKGAGNALLGTANSALNLASLDVNHEIYIKQQMAQIEKQQLLPNTAQMGSSNATLLGYDLMDNNIFTRYTIKKQFAEKIDKFFDMYGYLTNNVKIPNLNNRPNWNYIKTIGINILGDIPQDDLQVIKNMFNNGLTLWHNTETFLDYSQNNR